jgi:hypothetical protein
MSPRRNRTRKSGKKSNVFYTSGPPNLPSKVDYATTLVNPFDPAAEGTKIHDANASNTFTYQVRALHVLSVNNNGTVATEIYPSLAYYIKGVGPLDATIDADGTTGAAAVFVSENIPEYTALVAAAYRYRIVSWGVRLISTSNALDASGSILIRELEESALGNSVDLTRLTDNYMTVPHTHDMDVTIIPNHIAEHYQEFKKSTTSYINEDSAAGLEHGWRAVGITGTGFKPSGTADTQVGVLQAEVVMNLEIIPEIDGIGSRMTSPAAPHSNETLELVHNTRSNLALVHKTPSLWSKVKAVAKKALTSVGEYALDRLTGGVSSYVSSLVQGRPRVAGPSVRLLTNG